MLSKFFRIFSPCSRHTDSMRHRISAINPENCIFLFFVAAIVGYLWEVLLFFLAEGEVYNRGFFYGPWLPVYGTGAVLIFLILYPQRKQLVRCFFFSAIIGAAVEFFTGKLLHELFCRRYWNYTGEFMHIGGYVCMYSVLGFALAGSLFVCVAAPFLLSRFERLPRRIRRGFLALLLFFFLVDAVVSLFSPNEGLGITVLNGQPIENAPDSPERPALTYRAASATK